ncbi:MAG: hypothetical protein JOY69_06885 [Candidatus Eremiobacteraeota bacterium]|nr:hypothetical protein [Candidatus Eremiobacteraeota bacterium]
MRRILLCALVAPLLFAFAAARAQATTLVRLSADRVAFYYDTFRIEADGNVRVQTSDGFSVSGDAFSMDLKLNRFLVAGHVVLQARGQQVSGAALSDFLDFNRIYFVPVTNEPDRWTFLNGDLTNPVKGRIMPGDTFAFPEVPQDPNVLATAAVIGTKSYVRFAGARALIGGIGLPLGSYVVNFSPNQYFAQNSLTGANFDATWNFAGSNNSLSALHLRYDTFNHTYFAFEQHFVGEHEYAIFSVNPLTKQDRFFNLFLYDKLGERFQVQTFTQFNVNQNIFSKPPYSVTQTTYVNMTEGLPHAYLQLNSNFTNYNLLGPGSFNVPGQPPKNPVNAGNLSHPSQIQLTATQTQNRLGPLPLYEQIYGGYGFNHDSVGSGQYLLPIPPSQSGLQSFGGNCIYKQDGIRVPCPTTYTTIWNTVAGFNLFTPAVKIGNSDKPYQAFFFNAAFNKQRQWNSLPHHIDNTTTTLSLSRQFARPVNSYLSYQVQNTGDYYYQGGYQPCNLQPNPTLPNYCPSNLAGFRGVSTLRTLSLGVNYVPNPEFNLSLIGQQHTDFPRPGVNVFPLPLTNVIGQPLYNNYLGQPPYNLTGDVRFKLLPHMLVDVQRTYYFNFGNIQWSPNFIVQVLPQ